MGVPAYDAFPVKLWARLVARAARADAAAPGYPDPRGALELRAQIAGYLAKLALMLRLPPGTDDVALESAALTRGLAPAALSSWYATSARAPGLLLSVTNLADSGLQRACDRLRTLVERA